MARPADPFPPLAVLIAAALLAVLVAACAGAPSPSPAGSPVASPTPAASAPPSPVDGVVIDVEASGLTEVSAFTLRTPDGVEVPFVVGELENADTFPPSHLATHLADAYPVRVWFRSADGALVAYRLEDAAASS